MRTSEPKPYQNQYLASAHDFPKFVKGGAAMVNELRKVGISVLSIAKFVNEAAAK